MTSVVAAAIAARTLVSSAVDGGKARKNLEIFNLNTDAQAAYSIGAAIPKGARITGIRMMTSATLGSSTIAIGIAGTPEKYRAAATFTSANTWTEVGAATALFDELTAEEQLIMTVAAAALPSSGRLLFEISYVDPT